MSVEAAPPIRRDGMQRALMSATAGIGAAGLTIQFMLSMRSMLANGRTLVEAVVWFFSFFTVLTNTIVTATLLVLLLKSDSAAAQRLARPVVQTGIAAAITLVGIVYELLLRRLWHPQGLQFVADVLLHDVTPVLFMLYWIRCVPKGALAWRHVWLWVSYPTAYLIYVLLYGAWTTRYPYPFLDAGTLGYGGLLRSTAAVLAGFLCIGFTLVAADRWLALARASSAGSSMEECSRTRRNKLEEEE